MKSEYGLYDFTESLKIADIKPEDVEEVLSAYGGSDEGGGSWNGGFILKMKDGRYAHVSGWCDYTGWGCQDGAEVEFSDKPITVVETEYELDEGPIDLNKWLQDPERKEAYAL